MKYMLLLHEVDTDWTAAPQEELAKALAAHGAFVQFLRERGRPFSGEAVRPSHTATTLRPDGDGILRHRRAVCGTQGAHRGPST